MRILEDEHPSIKIVCEIPNSAVRVCQRNSLICIVVLVSLNQSTLICASHEAIARVICVSCKASLIIRRNSVARCIVRVGHVL